MIGNKGPFPEKDSASRFPASEENGPNFIRSSESVGGGHEDSPDRLAKFSNEEFPNTETGTGKTPGHVDSNLF